MSQAETMKMQIADLESKVFELQCKNEELQERVESAEISKERTLNESNKTVERIVQRHESNMKELKKQHHDELLSLTEHYYKSHAKNMQTAFTSQRLVKQRKVNEFCSSNMSPLASYQSIMMKAANSIMTPSRDASKMMCLFIDRFNHELKKIPFFGRPMVHLGFDDKALKQAAGNRKFHLFDGNEWKTIKESDVLRDMLVDLQSILLKKFRLDLLPGIQFFNYINEKIYGVHEFDGLLMSLIPDIEPPMDDQPVSRGLVTWIQEQITQYREHLK
jgi:hypothetical protein